MFKSDIALKKRLVFLSALTLLTSNNVFAEIYKWQNARGVIQYSDTPPPTSYTKVTRNELLNAIQSKDVCTVSNTNTNKKTAISMFGVNIPGGVLAYKVSGNNTLSIFSNQIENNNIGSNAGLNGASASSRIFNPLTSNSSNAFSPKARKQLAQNSPIISKHSALGQMSAPIKLNIPSVTIPSPTAANSTRVETPPKPTVGQATPTATETPLPKPTGSIPGSNIVQVALMPAVDISKNVPDAIGYSDLRIQPTTEQPLAGQDGAVRITCEVSRMSNDDPLVYPNQPGAAHHHTFFGNTTTNAKSDLMSFANTGNSTCKGGIMNRSAYWVPSMIDTVTHTPIVPQAAIFYYKRGYTVPAAYITAPPKGLRMIAGNSKATSESTMSESGQYSCIPPDDGVKRAWFPWQRSIPNCDLGWTMQMNVGFPQCWDGVNLDSPDHKSHMAFPDGRLPTANKCPATHPIAIPNISVNFNFKITQLNQTKTWRLASDNYSDTSPGGYTAHADWVNGWDEKVMASIVKNCLQKDLDGHAHLLCDGRTYY